MEQQSRNHYYTGNVSKNYSRFGSGCSSKVEMEHGARVHQQCIYVCARERGYKEQGMRRMNRYYLLLRFSKSYYVFVGLTSQCKFNSKIRSFILSSRRDGSIVPYCVVIALLYVMVITTQYWNHKQTIQLQLLQLLLQLLHN